MAGVRGRRQDGRTGQFAPDETATVTVRFRPDDPDREDYEFLVKALDVSGAEVARRGMKELAKVVRQQAAEREKTDLQEAG